MSKIIGKIDIILNDSKFEYFESENINVQIRITTEENISKSHLFLRFYEEKYWHKDKEGKSSKCLSEEMKQINNNNIREFSYVFKIPSCIEPSFEYPANDMTAYVRYYLCVELLMKGESIKELVIPVKSDFLTFLSPLKSIFEIG